MALPASFHPRTSRAFPHRPVGGALYLLPSAAGGKGRRPDPDGNGEVKARPTRGGVSRVSGAPNRGTLGLLLLPTTWAIEKKVGRGGRGMQLGREAVAATASAGGGGHALER
jgi:hypothetical protein